MVCRTITSTRCGRTATGSLWIGTAKGLVRSRGGKFETYTTRDGLSDDVVTSLYEDAEGSLWIGTNGGVSRRSGRGFDRFGAKRGTEPQLRGVADRRSRGQPLDRHERRRSHEADRAKLLDAVRGRRACRAIWRRTVLEGRDGTIWIGTQGGGLNRVKDGRVVSVYTMRDGLPGDTVTALLERADGSLWIGTAAGLARLHRGRISAVRADQFQSDSIRALFEGRDGALWVGTSGGGLKILRDGHVTVWDAKAGLSDVVRSFYEDPSGTVWVGSDAGLSRYVDGRFETFGAAQGVFRKGVMTISGDPDGTIWAGTYGDGLYRYKDGRFTHYTTANGLFDDVVFQIVDDRQGSLWMTCNRGVFRVAKKMLDDLAEGRASAITSESFGVVRRDAVGRVQRQRAARGLPRARRHALVPDHQRRRVGAPGQAGREHGCRRRCVIDRLLVDRHPVDLASATSACRRATASSSSATRR